MAQGLRATSAGALRFRSGERIDHARSHLDRSRLEVERQERLIIANFHALTPFPGTELFDNIEKYGTISGDLSDFTYQGAAFVPYTMTREEISALRQLALRKFYSRPGFIAQRILKLRSIHELKAALKGFKSLFWLWVKSGVFHHSKT